MCPDSTMADMVILSHLELPADTVRIRKVARSVLVISETSKTSSNFSTHLMDLKVNFILFYQI